MTVHVVFRGPIRRPFEAPEQAIETEEGTSVSRLLDMFGYSPEEQRAMVVHRNGTLARAFTRLQNGDRIEIAILMGGG